jgi:hypothetical protein
MWSVQSIIWEKKGAKIATFWERKLWNRAKLDNTFLEIAKTNQDPKEYKFTFLFDL